MKSRHTENPFAALAAELNKPATAPSYEDGWRTNEEIRAETGWGSQKTYNFTRAGFRSGNLERWVGVFGGARQFKYRVKKIYPKKLVTLSGR